MADPLHKVWDYMKEQVPILKPKDKFLVTDGLKTSRSGAIRRKTAEGLMPLEEDEAQGIPSQSGVTGGWCGDCFRSRCSIRLSASCF